MAVEIRNATADDAVGMAEVMQALAAVGKRNLPSDEAYAHEAYISHPDRVLCSVAVDADGRILGFQSLRRATEGNSFDVTPGWGIIGTHIHPSAARQGIGKALFAATLSAAKEAGLPSIDATIGLANGEGRAYYRGMGFAAYETSETHIRKRFDLL